MIDLRDCTFIIPVRIDCPERLENLLTVYNYLTKHFDTNIIIVESDKQSSLPELSKAQIIQAEYSPSFHRTKILNIGFEASTTDIVINYDTDVLFNVDSYVQAANVIRDGEHIFCYPYDGSFFDVASFKQKVMSELDVSFLTKDKTDYMHHASLGGAIFADRIKYKDIGFENPNFVNWGFEDDERRTRANILGYTTTRIDGTCWHLSHPRIRSPWYSGSNFEASELRKVQQMTPDQLKGYIKTW